MRKSELPQKTVDVKKDSINLYKNKKSTIPGFLEDYAIVIDAFIALYEITFDDFWLEKARKPWMNNVFNQVTNRSFYTICIIKYLLQTVNPSHHIKEHLIELMKKYPNTPIQFMGIPSNGDGTLFNWENEPLWK